MKQRKIPLRKCIGCNESKAKKELIRVVKNKENQINIDLTGKANGRGAYICNNAQCFKQVKSGKLLNRSLKSQVPDEVYDKLLEEVTKNE